MPDVTDDSTQPSSTASAPSSSRQGALSEAEQERNRHVQRTASERADDSEEAIPPPPNAEDGPKHTTEPRTFTVVRRADESGVSGTGRVLDGCIFHNGQVVICWRGDINSEKSGYSSLAIYPCWEAFYKVHIGAHPANKTEVVFGRSGELMARLIDRAAEGESAESDNDQKDDDRDE